MCVCRQILNAHWLKDPNGHHQALQQFWCAIQTTLADNNKPKHNHLLISLYMHYYFVHKKERIYLYRSKYGHWCIGKHCHCLCVCRCLCLCICTTETLLYKAQARKETDECHICGVVPETLGKRFPFPNSVFCTRL